MRDKYKLHRTEFYHGSLVLISDNPRIIIHSNYMASRELPSDPNVEAYHKLESDSDWVRAHQGQFVAFADGKLIAQDISEEELFKKLQLALKALPVFYSKVGVDPEIIDLPTPLSIEDVED